MHTRSGWLDRLEVVEVRFDPTVVSYEQLLTTAIREDCATRVYAHTAAQLAHAKAAVGDRAVMLATPATDAQPSDQLFALGRSPHRFLPLTPMQATKVNADLRLDRDAERWLSPRQRDLLRRIERALERDADALKPLARPQQVDKLIAYQVQLIAAIDAMEAQDG